MTELDAACVRAAIVEQTRGLAQSAAVAGPEAAVPTAPGWTVTVDGKPAAIERADVVVRAVKIDPGTHDLIFRYRTPGLRVGALVSGVSWAGLAVLLWITRRRRA